MVKRIVWESKPLKIRNAKNEKSISLPSALAGFPNGIADWEYVKIVFSYNGEIMIEKAENEGSV